MSLYKSKGLTAELVVLTGLVDGLIPQAPKPEDSEEKRESLLAEQRRLFYVGLTRTTNILLLSSEYELPDSFVQSNRIRRGQWRNDHYTTYASPFLRELGPTLPAAVRGEDWRY